MKFCKDCKQYKPAFLFIKSKCTHSSNECSYTDAETGKTSKWLRATPYEMRLSYQLCGKVARFFDPKPLHKGVL